MMDSFISVGPVYKLAGIVLTGQKTEAVVWRCSVEIRNRNFAKFTGKPVPESLF